MSSGFSTPLPGFEALYNQITSCLAKASPVCSRKPYFSASLSITRIPVSESLVPAATRADISPSSLTQLCWVSPPLRPTLTSGFHGTNYLDHTDEHSGIRHCMIRYPGCMVSSLKERTVAGIYLVISQSSKCENVSESFSGNTLQGQNNLVAGHCLGLYHLEHIKVNSGQHMQIGVIKRH